jgi:hypothetical protein
LFNQKVVFVVGAGASREYNFPLGSHLKDRIAADVRFRFEYGSQMKSGSPELLDHIRRHVKGDNVRTNEYTRAANLLASAIPSFVSIDEALHFVSGTPEAVEVGKIAIVDHILRAERSSTLALDPQKGRLTDLPDGWIGEMFSMAVAGSRREDLASVFDNVTFGTGKGSAVVMGTVSGIHKSNHELIAGRIAKNLNMHPRGVDLHDMKASEMLRELRPRIQMLAG